MGEQFKHFQEGLGACMWLKRLLLGNDFLLHHSFYSYGMLTHSDRIMPEAARVLRKTTGSPARLKLDSKSAGEHIRCSKKINPLRIDFYMQF